MVDEISDGESDSCGAAYMAGAGKERPGAGLGVSIACALIDAQKGDIRFESELGRGTTATVILPNC